jgi:hypothetical protein
MFPRNIGEVQKESRRIAARVIGYQTIFHFRKINGYQPLNVPVQKESRPLFSFEQISVKVVASSSVKQASQKLPSHVFF